MTVDDNTNGIIDSISPTIYNHFTLNEWETLPFNSQIWSAVTHSLLIVKYKKVSRRITDIGVECRYDKLSSNVGLFRCTTYLVVVVASSVSVETVPPNEFAVSRTTSGQDRRSYAIESIRANLSRFQRRIISQAQQMFERRSTVLAQFKVYIHSRSLSGNLKSQELPKPYVYTL